MKIASGHLTHTCSSPGPQPPKRAREKQKPTVGTPNISSDWLELTNPLYHLLRQLSFKKKKKSLFIFFPLKNVMTNFPFIIKIVFGH